MGSQLEITESTPTSLRRKRFIKGGVPNPQAVDRYWLGPVRTWVAQQEVS